MDDPETHELIAHFADLVAQRAWGTVVLEQVPAFFGSTAWEMVLGRATAAGYLLVGVVKVDVRDCGLYQSRTRCIAVLTLQGPPKYDFESCVRALAALEAAAPLRLADYFVAPHQYAEYGVSQDDAREHRLLTVQEASKLEHALAIRRVDGKPAPLTVRQAARHWIFIDLDRSESWVHAVEGCVPTLTRAHASRSIYCTHSSVSRFLFPIEHLLFMGAQRPQVKVAPRNCRRAGAPVPSRQPPPIERGRPQAAVKTFASRPESKRRIAELAGNAVPMELMLVVLRALAHCYPAVFRVWEPPPAGAAEASPASW